MKNNFNLNTNLIIFYDCARQDESWMKWVLCRVYEKKRPQQSQHCYGDDDDDEDDSGTEVSWLDEVFMSLDDDLDEPILLP